MPILDPNDLLEKWRCRDNHGISNEALMNLVVWLKDGGVWPEGLTVPELRFLKIQYRIYPPSAYLKAEAERKAYKTEE